TNYTLQHLTSFSLNEGTIKSRFEMWKMATSGLQERPIFGWGRENFSYVFDAQYKYSDFESAGVGEQWEDRAHNIFFDEAINGGIVELLAYIALLVTAFITMRKRPVLLAALISYTVQNLFGVDTLNSFLPFLILLAFADFLKQQRPEASLNSYVPIKMEQAYAISIVGVGFVLLASFQFTIKPMVANANVYKAAKSMMTNQYETFKRSYKNGIENLKSFSGLKREYLTLIGSTLVTNASPLVQTNAYLKYANIISADFETIYKANALEQKNMLLLAQLFLQRGVVAQNMYLLDQSEDILKRLLEISPNKKLFQTTLEKLKSLKENAFKAPPVPSK
ncbi:MAG: O-antigen ligase family protein, partial [Patescibacteria group bacterium]